MLVKGFLTKKLNLFMTFFDSCFDAWNMKLAVFAILLSSYKRVNTLLGLKWEKYNGIITILVQSVW